MNNTKKKITKSLTGLALAAQIFTLSNNALAVETATYEIKFTNQWNQADHVSFPDNAHFSPILTVSHNENYKLFEMGKTASAGFELLAERGRTESLIADIDAARLVGDTKDQTLGDALWPIRDGIEDVTFQVTVDKDHDLISFATMIAPSPDWVVGVDSLDTFVDGAFIDSIELDLTAINGGTEEGDFAGNFSGDNAETAPIEVISSLDHIPGLAMPFAKVKIVKIK